MASEAISSSIMIIGAAVGAAVLIAAILPAIFSAGDTFGTVAYSAEKKLKTDFQIVNTFVNSTSPALPSVWLKNVGSERISVFDIQKGDVFFGLNNEVYLCSYDNTFSQDKTFRYVLSGASDGYWDIGETVEIQIHPGSTVAVTASDTVYFSFTLPNSIRRTTTFALTQF